MPRHSHGIAGEIRAQDRFMVWAARVSCGCTLGQRRDRNRPLVYLFGGYLLPNRKSLWASQGYALGRFLRRPRPSAKAARSLAPSCNPATLPCSGVDPTPPRAPHRQGRRCPSPLWVYHTFYSFPVTPMGTTLGPWAANESPSTGTSVLLNNRLSALEWALLRQ
ncbi:unnamed protein product [Ectocarpus sp. 12 AP-2014]